MLLTLWPDTGRAKINSYFVQGSDFRPESKVQSEERTFWRYRVSSAVCGPKSRVNSLAFWNCIAALMADMG